MDPDGVKDADTVQKRNEMIESYLKQVRDVDGANPMFAKLFEAYVKLNAANGIDWEEEEFALRKSIVRVKTCLENVVMTLVNREEVLLSQNQVRPLKGCLLVKLHTKYSKCLVT